MALNELKGFGSIRFYLATLADWNASTKILSVNEWAFISDMPGAFKIGQATSSLQKTGPVFSALSLQYAGGASFTTGITAHSGGGQGSATQLASQINEVTVVAASGDSVKLPAAIAGKITTILNTGAQALAVFPATGDSINSLAVNLSVYIAPGVTKTFIGQDTTVWRENVGPASVNRTASAINATATATAAQVGTGDITSTSAAGTSITLPTATLMAAYLGAAQGTSFDFIVDNTGGANIVTLILGAGMTQPQVDSGALTVPVGGVGYFKLVFSSTTAAVLLRLSNSTSVRWYSPIASQQALSGAGAINLTSYLTAVTTTGANALTLANSGVTGQVKKVLLAVDGGDGTLSLTGFTSIVLNDAGDYVILQWNGSAWICIENSGCVITP